MLFKQDVLSGIESGRITTVYRKWEQARIKTGSSLRTMIGVVEVISVEVVDPESLTVDDAVAAGYETVPDLIASAGSRGPTMFRIRVRHTGPDPREALRETIPDQSELEEIDNRLRRLDSAATHGAWTRDTLQLISANPGVRAEDLAASVGREKMPFKLDVRKLKELGLTESLRIGYRLSRRGESVLARLSESSKGKPPVGP